MSRPSRMTLLALAGGVYLLYLAGDDPLWSPLARALYGAYLVWVLWVALTPRFWQRWLWALWMLLAVALVVMSYTPSGWMFAHKALLTTIVMLVTFDSLRDVRPVPHAGRLTVAVTLALAVLLTYALDRSVGLIVGERQPGGLVFSRYSHVSYTTPEFRYTANINSAGFRGPDVDLAATPDCRVMLLGDSFTYGWGVSYPQTWGALLESALVANGLDVQVLNLGVPGGNPPDYAAIATTAAPLLRPDVVLVGVLQGDDMRQMSRKAGVFPRSLTFGEVTQSAGLHEFVVFHYPFIAERTVLANTSARHIRTTWAATAADFIAGYDVDHRARFDRLPDDVRGWYTRGDINPHFVHLAITAPDYWLWPRQDVATLRPYINDMGRTFADIRMAAGEARVHVVSIPHGAYTQPTAQNDLRRLGFDVPADLLANSRVDDAIVAAAAQADVVFIRPTDAFRDEAAPAAFYPIDGHLNAAGSQLLAAELVPHVRAACDN